MDKRKIVSLLISFALIFTTVFAGASMTFADSGSDTVKGTSVEKSLRTKTSDSTTIKAKYMQYGSTQKTNKLVFLATGHDGRWYVPVVAQATGKLYFDAAVPKDSESSMHVVLYKTLDDVKNDENYVDSDIVDVKEIAKGIGGLDVEKGKTYYIGYETAKEPEEGEPVECKAGVGLTAYVYSYGDDRTIPVGKTLLSSGKEMDKPSEIWYKIKPTKTGVISVILTKPNGGDYNWGTIQLFNAKKKALSNPVDYDEAFSSYKAYFGVKKDTTYYLKVTDPAAVYNFKGMYAYGIKFTQTARTDRAIGTKAKAKQLYRTAKSATNTLFVASTGTSTDWYKFKVTKKRTTRININASTIKSGNLKVTVYKGKKKVDDTITVKAGRTESINVSYGSTHGKATSGTYYVKVVKSKKASGKYSIRYVK